MLLPISGQGGSHAAGFAHIQFRKNITGSGGAVSGGFANLSIKNVDTGRGIASSGGSGHASFSYKQSGQGGATGVGKAKLSKLRRLSEEPVVYGANLYCLFYPPVTFNYVDNEPGAFATSEDEIKGLVTGVEQLGSTMQMAFVGEEVDIRWYGATDGVDDWGDGNHEVPPGFTHTYTEPGVYLIKYSALRLHWPIHETFTEEDTIVSAKAVRMMKVVERGNGSGSGGNIDINQPIYLHPEPYGVLIDPVIEGTIEGTFGMRFTLRTNAGYPNELHVGRTEPRCGLAVFAETYENGVLDTNPQIKLVAAGYMTQRTLELDPKTGELSGLAYDPLYWLNLQNMRDQFYTNTSYLGLMGLQDSNQQLALDNLDCATPTPPIGTDPTPSINIPALDLALLGYVPEHVLKTCNPIYAAAHVLQHVRVTIPYFGPGGLGVPSGDDPVRFYNLPWPSTYANLGQLTNIYTPPDFDEMKALGDYHGFSVPQGNVLPNIRQLLTNMGATFHSRSDGTFVFDFKPFYKEQLPPPTYVLDVPKAISPVKIGEGTPLPVFRVQVQKPVLGLTTSNVTLPNNGQTPLNPATGEPASLADLGNLLASNAYVNGLNGVSAAAWSDWYRQVSQPLLALAGSPQTVDINNWDYYNDSLDQRNFLWEVQVGEPGGVIIGPIQNVFAEDLTIFAIGVAFETGAHWQLDLPLGNAYHINLGDVVYVNYTNDAMQIAWTAKPFWVTSLRQLTTPGRYTRQVTLLEIRSQEVRPPTDWKGDGGIET